MMFAQIQQWAALLLIFGAASTTHAKPNRLSHAGSIDEVQQQQQHSQIHKRDASVPMTTIQLQHGEHINSLSTLKQAIEGGRKTQQVKSTNPTKLNSYAQTACYDVAATNIQNTYTIPLKLGHDRKSYTLIVDTGSSITWVGAQDSNPYHTSSSTDDAGQAISVTYGSGSFSGELYYDTVRLGGLTITDQGVAGATTSNGFQSGIDGIIGFAPTALTRGLLSPSSSQTVPTITDTAASENKIPSEVLGVYFEPSYTRSNRNGEISIGGYDTSRMAGSIMWTPKSTRSGVKNYWGVQLTVAGLGNKLLSSSAGIVDTGTTAIFFASDAFQAYMNLIPGATLNEDAGLIQIPKSSLDSIPDLRFTFADTGRTLTLNKYAQLFDPSIAGIFGLSTDYYYSWIVDLGTNSGSGGFDFILGQKFLERYYSIYDTANSRVGFARTAHSRPTGFGQ